MPAWHEPERIRSSIEAARAKPGELTLASVGPGPINHSPCAALAISSHDLCAVDVSVAVQLSSISARQEAS